MAELDQHESTVTAVTGANGFVGRALCASLEKRQGGVRRIVRKEQTGGVTAVEEIGLETDWSGALDGVQTVVHLAARVHVMADEAGESLTEFWRVNTEGTHNLAVQAAEAGVKRLVFLSSVKVNGEKTGLGTPFTLQDVPAPQNPYAISKFEAEQGLRGVEKKTGMEVVIIRPPLVYGPGVKANFLRLMQAVQKGLPLPLGLVRNRRSLVALDNLVALIVTCIDHPDAAGRTFLVSDGLDLSTPELIRKLAWAMGKKPMLFPVPVKLLQLAGSVIAKRGEVERLIDSLQVDITHACEVLGWRPPVSVDEAMWKTGQAYVSQAEK